MPIGSQENMLQAMNKILDLRDAWDEGQNYTQMLG